MIVVADSSPLHYLVLIQEIHLLPVLYGNILVPPGVISELSQPNTPGPVRAWIEEAPNWISVRSPQSPLPLFPSGLGRGEREAISLAEELGADALLVDDGAARREAFRRQIPVQGTLGIVDLAAENGFADMRAAVDKLLSTNFRASRKLIQVFLDRDSRRRAGHAGHGE